MGRNGVALLASWDNTSKEKAGWGCRGGETALLPPHTSSICPRKLSRVHRLGGLTCGLGLGVLTKAEARWKLQTSSPTLSSFLAGLEWGIGVSLEK